MAAYSYSNGATATALFLIALLFVASNPLAHGQEELPMAGLSVSGSLCCTPTGNCPGRGVSGVPVSLNCNVLGVGVTVLGRGITNVNGIFNIYVPTVSGLILGLPIIPCVATVQLRLSPLVCPVLSTTTGLLTSALIPVGTVVNATSVVQNVGLIGFIKSIRI
ncbi:hypothetical protein ABFS83_03G031900 [Erythranthe nasuta]